jgi:hypothetical protein
MALFLLLPLSQYGSATRPTLILMAAGNRLLETPAEHYVPFHSGGWLYVPYTLFNNRADLGINARWHADANELSINTFEDHITWNLNTGTAIDSRGFYHWAPASVRNGIPFVPAVYVAEHFGLAWSMVNTGQVQIFRVRAERAAEWTDAQFLSRVRSAANAQAHLYYNPPVETPTPVVCLAITGLGDGTAAMLDVLDEFGVQAAFFLEPSAIPRHVETIWRILGGGHSVGLLLPAGSEEGPSLRSSVDQGASFLQRAAFRSTRLLWLDTGDDAEVPYRGLAAAGWVVWSQAADGSLLDGAALHQAVEGGEPVPLRFMDGQSAYLARALRQLIDAGSVIAPLDERLSPAS